MSNINRLVVFKAVYRTAEVLLLTLFIAGCGGGEDTFEEGLALSAEVQSVSTSDDSIRVGDRVSVRIEVETGSLFGEQSLVLFVRYSPQLELVSAPYVSIDGVNLSEDDGTYDIGSSYSGEILPFCQGNSQEKGDRYFAVYIDSNSFSYANNDTGFVTLQFEAVQEIPNAFVTASAAEKPDSPNKCASYSADVEGAVGITIAQ